jgi:hypothetical protein
VEECDASNTEARDSVRGGGTKVRQGETNNRPDVTHSNVDLREKERERRGVAR